MSSEDIQKMFQLNVMLERMQDNDPQKPFVLQAFNALHKIYIDECFSNSLNKLKKMTVDDALNVFVDACNIATKYEDKDADVPKEDVSENVECRKMALKTIVEAMQRKPEYN